MEEDRYTRNILVAGIGREGQLKLLRSRVLVIGAGGLGSPVLYYLAAAGVGTIGIADVDVVDVSNLQRQIIHQTGDIGKLKTTSAAEKIRALNPDVRVNLHPERITTDNAKVLFPSYDFIVDCCDNYQTKFLINDVCVDLQKPYSHGAVLALHGEAMTYVPGCADYRRVFAQAPADGRMPTSAEAGILGAIAGVIGCIQATETVKYLTGTGELITNRILIFDGRTQSFLSLKVSSSGN